MPIGIVSDEEFEKEIESHTLTKPKIKVPIPTPEHGRNKGDVNVPDSLRKIIGEESVINGRESALQLASEFGISPSSVSAYANGATSTTTYNSPKLDTVRFLNKSRLRATKKASKVLSQALSAITQEKLDYSDASDLSGIAKDMSVIIKNLEPQPEPTNPNGGTQPFVIYAPTFHKEDHYETINVTE
jgi:transcriptional regulator with XRE-family HTH domain